MFRHIVVAALFALSSVAFAPFSSADEGDGRFAAADDYLRQRNGHALLVYHRGELIHEQYYNGHEADRSHLLASGTKSFWGPLAIAAQEDGLLKLDEKVAETLTEWKRDPRKSQITIRQLISLTSGIEGGRLGSPPPYEEAVKVATSKAEPGKVFDYGPVPFQCFGELLRRKLEPRNETVEEYLKLRILDPIGLKVAYWNQRRDKEGNLRIPSGAYLTAREWAKFGLFILNQGKWEGKQLIPADKLQECFQGSKAQPNYGLTFWLNNTRRKNGIPKDLIQAAGKGKQKLYIFPSLDLLIVQFAITTKRAYKEEKFLTLALDGFEEFRKQNR
ncbi:MAG: serine hydrolase [Planctomycetes bacterium]|nr:serine hydrolase [Planctomycetota bacterium]